MGPIVFLSARSASFPAASYIARSVPLANFGFGFAVLTMISASTFVISFLTILNAIEVSPYFLYIIIHKMSTNILISECFNG